MPEEILDMMGERRHHLASVKEVMMRLLRFGIKIFQELENGSPKEEVLVEGFQDLVDILNDLTQIEVILSDDKDSMIERAYKVIMKIDNIAFLLANDSYDDYATIASHITSLILKPGKSVCSHAKGI